MNVDDNRGTLSAIIVHAMLVFLLIVSGTALALDADQGSVGGLSRDEAIRLGERMYREGILPSGEPMRALVQGDIPVDSRMFSCASCHLRSGLGSIEGRVVTYPIDGITLFKPMTKAWNMRWVAGSRYARAIKGDLRSAYNDETLATAIRGGVNPDGKTLNHTMPRYPISDKDMAIMIFYLKNLSVKSSPGVSETTISLATIISDDVSLTDRESLLGPLELMSNVSKTGKSSKMAMRALASDPDDLMNKGYMKLLLSFWELKGPKESWRNQLENYYEKEPVFAIIGGMSNGNWSQVHRFCEEKSIPCILPIVDLPAISETDWYTIYFSKGLYQEGEAAARYLKGIEGMTPDVPVVEVYRDGERGRATAAGFDEAWASYSEQKTTKLILPKGEAITDDFWKKISASAKKSIILLWLDSKDISSMSVLSDIGDKPRMMFLSSTLLENRIYELPERLKKFIFITYPYRLPEDFVKYLQPGSNRVQVSKNFMSGYSTTQAKTNFGVMLITKSIFMLKGYFVRDRVLEVMDMMKDELMVPLYPKLSFGPGQRYLAKGCFIVQVSEGPDNKVIAVSDWIVI